MTLFRPISLCNTTYKILSKVLVQRIRPLLPNLVSPNQVAFVPNRQIQDNIVVAQEVLHKFKNTKGHMGYIAWKIDLAKAYDKLKWSFIKEVLEEIGIGGKVNDLIMSCISSVQYQVVVNGEVSESFAPRSGIRQGDPLSPYIFVLCMEKLSHIIQQKLEEGIWKPVTVSRGGPEISHLFFADDLILFGQASVRQAEIMRECMDTFCDLSGQQVSFPKSRVLCSGNINRKSAKIMADICGSPITSNLGNYLGVPLIHSRITKSTYKEILEKSQQRLASWKSASLSFAGRCTLIKAVASALPIYAMQSIKIPTEMCAKLDKLNRDFLWGNNAENKKIHLVKWDTVCTPKNKGGLGIKKTRLMNQALLAKAGWRMNQDTNGLWANILKGKYLKGGHIVSNIRKPSNCSSTWRGFFFGSKLLLKGMTWRVGDGSNISFWNDDWVPSMGKLSGFATSPLTDDCAKERVCDYLMRREWNLPKLLSVLPQNVAYRILSIHVGGTISGIDKPIWGLSKSGDFTVKTAYESHFIEDEMPEWNWKCIWKLKLPPRIMHFLWVLLHGKLLTNDHRASRGLTVETTCCRCKVSCKDSEHVFRSCFESIGIWEDLCKGSTSKDCFTDEWQDWLCQNLKCSNLIMKKYPSYLLFATTMWFLWKWRCERVFNPDFSLVACPGKIILKFVEDWWNANIDLDKEAKLKMCPLAWSPPPQDWVKINVDGSRNPVEGSIAAGGVIRDHKKKWLYGFALNKGLGSVIEAELWGALEGLKLAWMAGYKKVVLETDSQNAVNLLTNYRSVNHPLYSIIQACVELIKGDWSCHVLHIYRECNKVADGLASHGHSLNPGLSLFDEPPSLIVGVLEDDFEGLYSDRLVPSF
ncbi:hypothetical protein LWI29_000920 [Acer saccharum]|uniref:Uncharacterized protein n=1 Tax=Acer saccharum TaxID=4024 RepID=A0AA39S039_ACESA|nr:hypothetical protein LWI29_000920 [Acer saccharum]